MWRSSGKRWIRLASRDIGIGRDLDSQVKAASKIHRCDHSAWNDAISVPGDSW